MEDVGIKLNRLPIRDLRKVRDLEYFEGSLLAEFSGANGAKFLFSWVDGDGQCNRWMVVRTDDNLILRFLFGQKTLRDLLMESPDGSVYLVDINAEWRHQSVRFIAIDDLPPDYVPEKDSYFDPTMMPADARSPRTLGVLLDGEWDLNDLAVFPRRIFNAYAFLYLLGSGPGEVKAKRHLRDYVLSGGYVNKHLFAGLMSQVPIDDRPQVDAVQKRSPGYLSIRVEPDTGDALNAAVHAFNRRRGALHVEMSMARLTARQLAAAEAGEDAQLRASLRALLLDGYRRLTELLGLADSADEILEITGSATQAVAVVGRYYNAISSIAGYIRSGKARLPALIGAEDESDEEGFIEAAPLQVAALEAARARPAPLPIDAGERKRKRRRRPKSSR